MKLRSYAGMVAVLVAAPAMADTCWVVTQMSGVAAYATEDYKISEDGFRNGVFVIRIGDKPSIAVVGNAGSYDGGKTITLGDSTVIYAANGQGTTVEVWSVDAAKGVAYMTQSRGGFGPLNKASMFLGVAKPGC
jgi:hypothetical protein